MASSQKKYTTLVSNTLLFAISNFSSKLLSFFIRPYLSYALDSPDVMGVSSLLQQATNLLIPVVSLGVAYAVIRFGLDKGVEKASVFINGALSIFSGFALLVLALPLVRLIPNAADYLPWLYLCVLASCLRTLCTQFIRARLLNRLVAIDGVLTTLSLLIYYLVFLSWLHLGATGFLLANACADLTSMVFVFLVGGCWRYCKPKAFDRHLWAEMLRYCLPMIPASISFWIINASDMFFVQALCEDYGGRSGNYWVGLLSAGYFLPQVITIMGSIFYEAWQLSAVTEEQDREAFFSKIFRVYASVLFCCVAGVVLLCRPMMHLFKADYYDGWIFVPFLTLCSLCTCLNQFLNSVYVVYKRSSGSLYTMLAGAVLNVVLNLVFIALWGPWGVAPASFISLLLVFVLRAYSTRGLLQIDFHPGWLALNLALVLGQIWCLMHLDSWVLPVLVLTVLVCALNFREIYSMLQKLLGKVLRRRPTKG
ncbi:lipopolysaccharide biosynthesis protein [uncultured Subdoligranulum sp.]|uniref:lipopolysaccharide biosynthesis protein n=1 Tax=uncultured Subdoligranulum sp. TaxID=512298 RepID=UPI0026371BB8|nr:polysaccharide biosynthesis C-terminal domain-containing protein [uncultured Subdoligranulum sp.]